MSEQQTTLIIPHIPKTGGQSLRAHFSQHLTFNETFIHLGPWGNRMCRKQGLTPWADKPPGDRAKARVIIGHDVWLPDIFDLLPAQQCALATILREPAERWLSAYNYLVAQDHFEEETSFADFWRGQNHNYQVAFIWNIALKQPLTDPETMLQGCIDVLEKFEIIGTLDGYANFSHRVCDWLGLPPVTRHENRAGIHFPKKQILTQGMRAEIRDLCPYDYRLYEWAQTRSLQPPAQASSCQVADA